MTFERYWMFAAVCLIVALFLVRMVVAEQLTLQASLSFLVLLLLGAAVALFPNLTSWLAYRMGFTLPSNFFFAMSIAILALLYLGSQVTISRIELRTIALTQELVLLREQLERTTDRPQPAHEPEAVHDEPLVPPSRRVGRA